MSGLEFASLNTARARALLYGLVTLASMVVFGNISEICDSVLDRCPARLIWIIVFAVAATVVGGVMLAATLLEIDALLNVESVFSLLLLICSSICVGLVSSVRTGLGNVISVSFSWFCLVLVFILVFAALTSERGLLKGISNKAKNVARDLENGAPGAEGMNSQEDQEVPEEAYMHSTGNLVPEEESQEIGETPLQPVPLVASKQTTTE